MSTAQHKTALVETTAVTARGCSYPGGAVGGFMELERKKTVRCELWSSGGNSRRIFGGVFFGVAVHDAASSCLQGVKGRTPLQGDRTDAPPLLVPSSGEHRGWMIPVIPESERGSAVSGAS